MRTPGNHDPLIGKIIGGRYEVVRLIGKGATGNVYEVRSTRVARSFAMKTLKSDAAAKKHTLERFRREADVIARLEHPNIVGIIDWETLDNGSPAMVMEYLRGEDLAKRLEGGPLAWPLLARIADEMLAAISIAHAHGIVHRDLKPENVFLAKDDAGDERVKLLDFGVSKVRDFSGFATTDETVIGTPVYMSPEQADGRIDDIGPHSDVWAAGAILFEMATGTVAFSAPSVPAILYKICHGTPASLIEHRPDAPPAFVELVAEVFTREADRRIADISVVRARLRESLKDLPGVRFPEPFPPVVTKMPVEEKVSIGADAGIGAKATIDAKAEALAASSDARSPAADARPSTLAATTNADRVTTASVIQRRKLAPVAFAMLGIAAVAVVATVVVATRDKPARSSAAVTPPREPAITPHEATTTSSEASTTSSEGTATPAESSTSPRQTATTGGGSDVVPASASTDTVRAGSSRGAAREGSRPPVTKARTTDASLTVPTPPPAAEPPVVVPKKKACAKDDVECIYGDGT